MAVAVFPGLPPWFTAVTFASWPKVPLSIIFLFSHDPLILPRSGLIDEVLRNQQLGQQFEFEYHLFLSYLCIL